MSDDNNLIVLIKQLTELSGTVGRIEGKVGAISEDIRELKTEDKRQSDQLNHQNDLLAEHIMGVKTNVQRLEEEKAARKAKNEEHDARLEDLEADPKFKRELVKRLMYVSGILGAIGGILKFFDMW